MVRKELLEAALDSLPEGIALVGEDGQVVFWNRAAAAITGFAGLEVLARTIPESLESLFAAALNRSLCQEPVGGTSRGAPAHIQHKLGHPVAAIVRTVVLRDELGGQLGEAVLFHPAQRVDALPHGESGEGLGLEESQTSLEDRLETAFADFIQGGAPFGVLWINVDQAGELRKTHGDVACETMLLKVERALANGLRAGEELGRWGRDELLAICYERTPEMLAAHAQLMAGLARTADFRWWGDRVSITVSIGAAQAQLPDTLTDMLSRAQEAMAASADAGGNHITFAAGRNSCSPS